jgi:eukaryotic-like serine/threonine-protein kinase
MSGALLAQRYAIRAPLASGGTARLFQAEDIKLGRPVAIKLLDHATDESRYRLEREARITGSVNHPNVCAVTDVGTLGDGTPFLVMELLVGETLAARFARGRVLPLALAMEIIGQLLAGLDAAHALGIVHRDVKPSNIFLARTGKDSFVVKLLDFGSAQVPGLPASIDSVPLTRTGFVIGTAEYMSPEQLRGVRDFDARVDVYSAAVVLYEMLAGVRPFEGYAMPGRLNSIAYQKAPALVTVAPQVPVTIARVVDGALSTERERRPGRAADFLAHLHAPALQQPMTAETRIVPTSSMATPAASPRPAAGDGNDWDLATIQNPPPAFDDEGSGGRNR